MFLNKYISEIFYNMYAHIKNVPIVSNTLLKFFFLYEYMYIISMVFLGYSVIIYELLFSHTTVSFLVK